MYKDLKNKKIIITGSATGIGKSVTARLCAFGAKVAALDINKDKGSETVFNAIEYGGDIKFFEIDVKDEISVKNSIETTTNWLGGIDVLIHIAGILEGADMEINNFPEEIWDKVVDVNLRGSFLVTKYVSKIMIKQNSGVIILTSSPAGVHGGSSSYAYGSSKGGVHGLSLVLEQNLSKYGIRVNDVLPGSVKTPLKIKNVKDTYKKNDRVSVNEKIDELVEPDDVAKIYTFLASSEASLIKGSIRTQ